MEVAMDADGDDAAATADQSGDDEEEVKDKLAQLQEEENKEVKRSADNCADCCMFSGLQKNFM